MLIVTNTTDTIMKWHSFWRESGSLFLFVVVFYFGS